MYIYSVLKDTFDKIKKISFIVQIIIQIGYITFILYRLIFSYGNLIANIILFVVSSLYFVYHVATRQEFYTKTELEQKKKVRITMKITKYIVNTTLIVIATQELINGTTQNHDIALIMLLMMILGMIVSITFELLLHFIENQTRLFKAAGIMDASKVHNIPIVGNKMAQVFNINVDEMDEKDQRDVEKIDKRQKDKKQREKEFKTKTNK